ncbi:D-2-hydroxyglutarate dehydrogenase, mitochondrial [Diabrotica virgifera virgifera]|uniref:D-2-hydroxyglutarate dehydrogenase, mitochondrial n=1 Tax=Diabrotica virgifera virgifera TaxID=50390 RepID=A0A6P7FLI3_DIAVI|nr:D-2-hydroxyglutarate dehydrogenase, mitochondrial [Diabrotica virgifera virgifera]
MFLKIFQNECLHFFKPNNFKGIGKRNLRNRPDFTKNRYKVTRGNYNYLREGHINYFQALLGHKRVIMDLSDLEKYNVDWYTQVRGCSSIVLKPKTTEEVSQILSFCNKQKLALCTQGGNTGVVGGCVPVFDEIIISTELMNDIISLDENSGVLVCQSGCILQNLDNFVAEKGLIIPLDLGAKGTCHIGGNVSTNAGGMRLLKYGNMHGNVLGLEVVTANGEIIDCLSTLKKDNTGYHLKHLFIGSEGTLGLVTKVALQCPPRPKYRNVAFLGVQNFDKVLKTFKFLKAELGEIISAVEVIDTPTMDFINQIVGQTSPIGDYPFYLLVETSGSNEQHDEEKLNHFFEAALKKFLVLNGTVASEPAKIQALWSIRENIPNGFKICSSKMMYYDVSMPLSNYYSIVNDVDEFTKGLSERVFGFGHLGDGNIHLQIQLKDDLTDEIKKHIDPFVFDKILSYGGSISAEHGIGIIKQKYMNRLKTVNTLNLMKDLKSLLDPNKILNPYKVIV